MIQTGLVTAATAILPAFAFPAIKKMEMGVQLYTFRKEMGQDAAGTLQKIAKLGFRKIETAGSEKGHYYGLKPSEMKQICLDNGMKLVSGHVHLDDQWEHTMDEALDSGQEYLICSTMPSEGQTVDNYKKVAEAFNNAGAHCKKTGLRFGYHNHGYEFESENGEVLYDVLLNNTDPNLVHMELDLGWVIVGGKDPLDYFANYPGRFPLWHLKDMDMTEKESTEFGKGGLDIPAMLAHQKASGVKHIFVEQEEYAVGPWESMKYNMDYLGSL
jgi:sugar phosphate isomerase/epimerase